jgi:hypothetical protein
MPCWDETVMTLSFWFWKKGSKLQDLLPLELLRIA